MFSSVCTKFNVYYTLYMYTCTYTLINVVLCLHCTLCMCVCVCVCVWWHGYGWQTELPAHKAPPGPALLFLVSGVCLFHGAVKFETNEASQTVKSGLSPQVPTFRRTPWAPVWVSCSDGRPVTTFNGHGAQQLPCPGLGA